MYNEKYEDIVNRVKKEAAIHNIAKNGMFTMMLVYVDDDWMDIGGNIYPDEGYVEANHYSDNIDIQHGLLGIIWGNVKRLKYEKADTGHWLVVKTESCQETIKIDHFDNYYKFRNGSVIFCGDYKSAKQYIRDHINDEDYC
jgi:hypothetical protein